jgi:hypothetical protein
VKQRMLQLFIAAPVDLESNEDLPGESLLQRFLKFPRVMFLLSAAALSDWPVPMN